MLGYKELSDLGGKVAVSKGASGSLSLEGSEADLKGRDLLVTLEGQRRNAWHEKCRPLSASADTMWLAPWWPGRLHKELESMQIFVKNKQLPSATKAVAIVVPGWEVST